jgi:hypothetical protein
MTTESEPTNNALVQALEDKGSVIASPTTAEKIKFFRMGFIFFIFLSKRPGP